jgi:hypothetical protein
VWRRRTGKQRRLGLRCGPRHGEDGHRVRSALRRKGADRSCSSNATSWREDRECSPSKWNMSRSFCASSRAVWFLDLAGQDSHERRQQRSALRSRVQEMPSRDSLLDQGGLHFRLAHRANESYLLTLSGGAMETRTERILWIPRPLECISKLIFAALLPRRTLRKIPFRRGSFRRANGPHRAYQAKSHSRPT